MYDALKTANDIIDRRERDSISLTLSEQLLLSIATDTREMLIMTRDNQKHIEALAKDIEHGRTNGDD